MSIIDKIKQDTTVDMKDLNFLVDFVSRRELMMKTLSKLIGMTDNDKIVKQFQKRRRVLYK